MNTAIQLFVLMAIFSLIEGLWPSSRAHKWWRRPLLVDLCAWLVHPLTLGAGIGLALAFVKITTALLPASGLGLTLLNLRAGVAAWPLWAQITLAFLIADFLSYWLHRAYHYFPALWAFHVVHHTSEELDWLSTSRLHPVSQIFDTALIATILLLLGMPVTAVLAANIIIGAAALLVHANVRWNFGMLQYLLVSPLFHQWHHAREDGDRGSDLGNYGAVLSIWDRLFGTWSLPQMKRPPRFGVADAPPPTLLGLVLHPFRVCIRFFLRACIKMKSGPAAADFGRGQGGELRASPSRQVGISNEPTPATGKRRAARRVFAQKGGLASLLLAHRSTRDMLAPRASPSGLLRENRSAFRFDTGSK